MRIKTATQTFDKSIKYIINLFFEENSLKKIIQMI
jgi:hypothetical protein